MLSEGKRKFGRLNRGFIGSFAVPFRDERGPLHPGIEDRHAHGNIALVSSVVKYVNHLDEGVALFVLDFSAPLKFDLDCPGQDIGIDGGGVLVPSGLCPGRDL